MLGEQISKASKQCNFKINPLVSAFFSTLGPIKLITFLFLVKTFCFITKRAWFVENFQKISKKTQTIFCFVNTVKLVYRIEYP